MKNKIIIITGDPNSVNSELIFKTYKRLSKTEKKNIYLVGNLKLFVAQFKKLNIKINLIKVDSIDSVIRENKLKIIDIPLKFKEPFNVPTKDASNYIKKSLDLAHKLGLNNSVKGIINCPINKKLLKNSKNRGVTEYFAKKCKILNNTEIMMIYNSKLSVVTITTHIEIKSIEKKINSNCIINKVVSLNKSYKKLFKKKPKIGMLGLNPHNDEFRKSSKEITEIIPAISKLKKKGFRIDGPLPADTVFINDYKKYNIIVGMYHDQVLAPFKALFHFNAINCTLGLKYLRISPDHGPAKNLIGKNKANFLSLFQCIKFFKNK